LSVSALGNNRLEGAVVEIDLAKGSATLRGLQIDNPKGYDSDYAFLLSEVWIAIDIASLKAVRPSKHPT
jgi:hypothetical protein